MSCSLRRNLLRRAVFAIDETHSEDEGEACWCEENGSESGDIHSACDVKTKPRPKESVSVGRKMLDQIPVMPVSVKEPEPIMSHLFWPAFPFAMMRMWWGTGASKGT